MGNKTSSHGKYVQKSQLQHKSHKSTEQPTATVDSNPSLLKDSSTSESYCAKSEKHNSVNNNISKASSATAKNRLSLKTTNTVVTSPTTTTKTNNTVSTNSVTLEEKEEQL